MEAPPTSPLARRICLPSLTAGLDEGRREAFHFLAEIAAEAEVFVYLVGGPVRDALLGSPVLDLDFSVVGDAIGLGKRLAERTEGKTTVHPRFGTATVFVRGCRIDLVTARSEEYPGPGQLPQVTPGSIGDDLARRDFTVNAMAMRVWPEDGELLDPMGGLDDLDSGIVRVLHPRSFVDDPTRMFRAVRYEQRLGFRIDEETRELMASAIAARHMDAVSGDRWLHEVERLLGEADPGPAFLRASQLGVLSGLHPALAKDAGIRALTERTEGIPDSDEWLAGLFSPLTATEGCAVIQRLRLSRPRASVARDTIDLRDMEAAIGESAGRLSDLYRILEPFAPQAIAARAKLTRNSQVKRSLVNYLSELRYVRSSLTGDDLLGMGAAQGPIIGEILTHLRDARLDGTLSDGEEERALARELLARSREGATK